MASYGEADERTLLSMRHLASCLRRQGRLDESRREFVRIAAVSSEIEGYPPLERAAILNGIGFIDAAEGNHAGALRSYQDALGMIRPVLAADDYRIGRSLFNIASAEEKLGRAGDAADHASQALAILRKRKGGDAATVQQVERLLERLRGSAPAQR
jgi:tetratricopeptide (TPR) repeat protein